jgi:hypothetical protein
VLAIDPGHTDRVGIVAKFCYFHGSKISKSDRVGEHANEGLK